MRSRPLIWLCLSLLCFAGALYFWRLGDKWAAKRTTPSLTQHAPRSTLHAPRSGALLPFQLLTQAGTLNTPPVTDSLTNHVSRITNQFALRLSNTTVPLRELQRSEQAILLENALFDTTRAAPSIPDHLRAHGDPGAYLVQCRGPIDNAFRSLLQGAGAAIISYIPNNAYLVRASAAVARQLQAAPQTQAVLPYEPYYKLKSSLLKLAVAQEPLPDNAALNVLLFADAGETTRADLQKLGARIIGDEESSPFGPVLQVRPPADGLPAIAGLPGVQEVEWALRRAPANDLSRARVGVATDPVTTNTYLGLTGSNVLVNINDSGVDASHPDLSPRVFAASTNTLVDPNGHGTHVAGIIASSGGQSSTVTNASGPGGPYSGTNTQFRGMAPAASLFALPVGMFTGPFSVGETISWPSDGYLQETAAQTNAFISNNSWNYVGPGSQNYDIHAASYDAAVRDALPNVSGAQPLLVVFSAGNAGNGDDGGTGGDSDTILSPGTAKNVITVGAIEQPRNITNKVWKCSGVSTNTTCTTNQPWLSMTDANNQVAAFSSRGPVGPGLEGDSGRFKPDLVAPGTFVISTKSQQWDTNAYYNPTSHIYGIYQDLVVTTNSLWINSIFIPDNAVQLNLSVYPNTNSPVPFPDLLIYVKQSDIPTNAPGGYDFLGTNQVSVSGAALSPVAVTWYYGIGTTNSQPVAFDLVTDIVVTNDLGNYLQVLEGMNDSLGPFYRYESGTSMSAADVSGTLALMQEFFARPPWSRTNSPTLMKALLINGARSVGNLYDFNVTASVVSQGWGLLDLPTTLPGSLTNGNFTTNATVMIDQSPTNALATGQSRTYNISVAPAAQGQRLRATLVWTDPPGNPLASVKLVNDLDLVVTNLDNTNLVYFGNDIIAGNDYNRPWTTTNTAPNLDTVNNVENIFLSPTLGISNHYSVTVVGRRVNVNAVTAQTNNVSQDYALVISSGDGGVTNAIGLDLSGGIISSNQPLVTVINNTFTNSPDFAGGILFNQRAGANFQLLGTNTIPLTNYANAVLTLGVTNQWHFYVITNTTSFTNAAFLTFLPVNLAVPRMGVYEPNAILATRPEADIDLYVAPPGVPNNFALTNLDPVVVGAATKSLGRGGTETIVYSNAATGVYYLGVKSEDQQSAEFALVGVFSREPFGTSNTNGDVGLLGFPTYVPIPDGSPESSTNIFLFAVAVEPIQVHRVIVTNIINHELTTDLLGNLTHGSDFAVLNNHTCVFDPTAGACQTWTTYIYDDSSEMNTGPDPAFINCHVQHTDGPGTLNNFAGLDGQGQWMLSMVDNALGHIGTNVGFKIFLERQPDLTGQGITVTLPGGACRDDFIDVPPNAVSLSVTVAVVSATGPVDYSIEICPRSGGTCKSTEVTNTIGGSVTIDQTDLPPLRAGTYRVRVCNLADQPITVHIRASFGFSSTTLLPIIASGNVAPVPILDDAVTDISVTNKFHNFISSVDVGLLIQDPRISDLAITLISPQGTRILLFENRGAASTNGLGTFNVATNYLMEPFYTNDFNLASVGLYTTGAVFQSWSVLSNFVDVLDDFTCLCLSNHILALFDGAVSNSLPTTNTMVASNSIPYTLSYKVNHLPWLEGMVTWWPLDYDGTDIFGGLNGLLFGDVAFTTGNAALFTDDFAGPLNPMWQASLPDAGSGGGATPIETYAGAPNAAFTSVGTNTVMRLSNTLSPLQRRGWSSGTMFHGQDFRYEVRFNTLTQGPGISTGGFIEIWILDAANSNRWDVISPFGGDDGRTNLLYAGSSIDSSYNTLTFNYTNDTWYRLVLSAAPNQGVRAAVLSDDGIELAGVSFIHQVSAFPSGYKIGLSQFVSATNSTEPVDVAIDWVRLTSGLSGEVNQAYVGDGIATRMVVPGCPELNLGPGRGFSIEGWINPANFALMNSSSDSSVIAGPIVNPANGHGYYLLAPMYWPDAEAEAITLGGHLATVRNDAENTWLYNTFGNSGGSSRSFYIGFTDQGHEGTWVWVSGEPVTYTHWDGGEPNNGQGYWPYENRCIIYGPAGNAPGYWNDCTGDNTTSIFGPQAPSYGVVEVNPLPPAVPLVEWYDPAPPTNQSPQGVQLWLAGLPGTNVMPGSIWANIWDTNLQPHFISTVTNAITNGGWQHIALTYDTNSLSAVLYTNGQQAAAVKFPTPFVPRTPGDVYLGFHPPEPPFGACYSGGMDEFSLYNRALSPCEVDAIFHAGSRGKYGTNVLVCPVVTEVTLSNAPAGIQVFTFTNGLAWVTNGPHWETNTINFSTSTNPTPIVVRGLNPYAPGDTNAPNNLNAVVDDFVLSELVPQTFDGLLHFTENTNLATIPIKFAPAPYTATNFPPVLIFSNYFTAATAGVYRTGATILGSTNSPAIGLRNWTVTAGPVTVVSNAYLDVVTTNWLAMSTGTVQCLLPTSPGHRYQLSYNLRGPCAVGWWNGSVDPLSQRAQDLISGNNGAFLYGATNIVPGFVGDQGFFFSGQVEPGPADDPDIWPEDIDDPASRIELADPPQLQFTNAFTIEGWIEPMPPINQTYCGIEQIFFRGYPEPLDCRGLGDPYWLALEPALDGNPLHRELHFHIADAHTNTLGADVFTTNSPILLLNGTNGGWQHIAAVFDKPFTNITVASNGTNTITITTNALRLYLNGVCIASNYTTLSPYKVLDPALSPGVTIGDRSRFDWTQPFSGFMDELTLYARALTEPEIAAIAAAGTAGKADTSVPPAQSLAKLSVTVDRVPLGTGNGDNSQWTTHSVQFTALDTNAVLVLKSLLPGTLLEGVTFTELPPELYYLPEVSLAGLDGEDAYGVWTLEIWDNRAGPANTNAQLVQWQLNLGLGASNPPPVITLSHGIPYSNSLPANTIQYFVVPVPQWATLATNILLFANQVHTLIPTNVTVLFNQTNFPAVTNLPLIGPLVSFGTNILATNGTPPLVVGQSYYLAVTNPNPVGVSFALGVWFDITTLNNCQMLVSNRVGQAGIPRYFQFDVPLVAPPPGIPPQAVSFWLSGGQCNLKVVLSEHLPLPDLNHYDYTSQQPCTNDQVIMLVTNTTPFPIQTNRWYAGVFNTGPTNAFFNVQACYATNYPVIIPLTNGVPFIVPFTNSPFAAPPGPPQSFFFDFIITNSVPGVLFELYDQSGNADLVLQPTVPPTMAPYFNESTFPGRSPQQIVVRTDPTLPADSTVPDLRGHWYLGVHNNESVNLAYTIRAVLTDTDGLLPSAQPLRWVSATLAAPHGLLWSWNSVVGERYIVQFTPSLQSPITWTNIGFITATTTLTTFEVLPVLNGGNYRLIQVFSFLPKLYIQLWPGNQVRISWSTAFPGYTLQSSPTLAGLWSNVTFPPATGVLTIGNEFVVYDPIGTGPKYYRLIK